MLYTVLNQQYYCNICNYGAPALDNIPGPDTSWCINIARLANCLPAGPWGEDIENCAIEQVSRYQERWQELGYILDADGIAGPITYRVAIAWQRDNGLNGDGIIGLLSYPLLFSSDARGPDTVLELPNFGPDEFACACGCGGDVDSTLKTAIQQVRDALSAEMGHDCPIYITSGFRCPAENYRQGGVPDSLHQYGQAVDFYTPGMSGGMIDRIVNICHNHGLRCGTYYSSLFVHAQIGGHDFSGD